MCAQGRRDSPIRLRGIVLALLLIPVNCYWIFQIEIQWYAGHPTTISLFFNVILFLTVVSLLNAGIRHFWPEQALSPGELVVVYVMLSLASAMGGHDMIQVLTPILAYPAYFSTPDNNWGELFSGKLPADLMVDSPDAARNLFEGRSSLYLPENYGPWLVPVLAWSAFLTVLVVTAICINSLFRKEWMENERLAYPVIEIPLAIATGPKRLCWNVPFLVGFGLAGGISLVNGLHVLVPDFPYVPVRPHPLTSMFRNMGHPWNAAGEVLVAYYPAVIGLSYLMPLDLLFSCWFFYLFWKGEAVLMAWAGVAPSLGNYVSQQATGAYLAIAAGALWIGRAHLREVWRKVLGRPSRLSDAGEPLGYRAAAVGALAGLAALVLFSWHAGMSLWVAVVFFLFYFALAAGIARMRATCGPPAHDLHYAGPEFILASSVGTESLGGQNLGVMTLFYGFNRAYRGHPMAHSLEGFKLAEQTGSSQRWMLAAQVLAVVAGCIASFWAILHLSYSSPNGASWVFTHAFGGEPYRRLESWTVHPTVWNPTAMFFYATGFLIALTMPLLKLIAVSIPFHPIGFAISTSWSMNRIWLPVFLAWAVKAALVRYGGGASYRRVLPFFLGLVLGDYLVGGTWCLLALAAGRGMYAFWP